jgi:predicted alpha/beta hydrolase family esterase
MDSKTRTFDKHWMPWLKSKLEDKGIKTAIPLMPEPWEPHYEEWKKEFEKLTINKDSILIGHSSGGGFLVRWLGETNKKIRKLILVAPAIIHSGEWEPLEDLLKFEINKKIRDNVGEIIIFVSNDDSQGIKESVEIFSEALDITSTELIGKGHFTMRDMGTEKFPELLDVVLNDN